MESVAALNEEYAEFICLMKLMAQNDGGSICCPCKGIVQASVELDQLYECHITAFPHYILIGSDGTILHQGSRMEGSLICAALAAPEKASWSPGHSKKTKVQSKMTGLLVLLGKICFAW